MRERMLRIADRLIKRADEFEKPFKDDPNVNITSASAAFAIVTTLREVAFQIRKELESSDG